MCTSRVSVFAVLLLLALECSVVHAQSAGQLGVTYGLQPTIGFITPSAPAFPQGSTAPIYSTSRGLALRYDSEGRLIDAFIAGPDSGRVFRYDLSTQAWSTFAYTGTPRAVAADGDGRVWIAMRTPADGGCVFRLNKDLTATERIWCDSGDRTPWAVAVRPDRKILIGWNDSPSMAVNNANGITLLDPETAFATVISQKNVAYSAPFLSSVALAPDGTVYLAEQPTGPGPFSGSVSYLNSSSDVMNNRTQVPFFNPHSLAKPEQIAIIGTAGAYTVYVADPGFLCAGPGGGFYCGFGAIVSLSTGILGSAYNPGPFGLVAVNAGVTIHPVDSATGAAPVSLSFDSLLTQGTTALAVTSAGPPPAAGFKLGSPETYYDLSTTIVYSGGITLCIDYSQVSYTNESELVLNHFENGVWTPLANQTLDTAAHIACGRTASLSPFALFEPAPVDTDAPSLSITASPEFLWPPNGKLVPVVLSGSVSDASGIASLTYEIVDEYKTGSTPPQPFTLPKTLFLEARRDGNDVDGRVYTIVVRATDTLGNAAQKSVTVTVKHDQR